VCIGGRLLLYIVYIIVVAYPSLLAKLKLFYSKYNLIFSSFPSLYLTSLCLKSLYLTSLYFKSLCLISLCLTSFYLTSLYLTSLYLTSLYLISLYLTSRKKNLLTIFCLGAHAIGTCLVLLAATWQSIGKWGNLLAIED